MGEKDSKSAKGTKEDNPYYGPDWMDHVREFLKRKREEYKKREQTRSEETDGQESSCS